MAFFRKIKAGLVKAEISEFVGEEGNIFFNIETGELRLSDGVTPGGLPLGDGSGYILPTASTTIKGGVKIDGTSIVIDAQGVISGFSGNYSDLSNQPVIPIDISDLTDATGLLNPIYTRLIDSESETNITYFGETNPGNLPSQPFWRIQKITYNAFAEVLEVRLAGNGEFTQIWNDRTSLIYT